MTDPMSPEGITFTPVSPALARVRTIGVLIFVIPLALIFAVLAIVSFPWWWIGTGVIIAYSIWQIWLIQRQVRALGFAFSNDEFMIRSGIMFRNLSIIPYGRIQYVDVSEGPIARYYGIASIKINTASNETAGSIDGLPTDQAAQLRDMLAKRGSEELTGL